MKFTHRKLCEDLAQTKGTKFFEVPLGPIWQSYSHNGNSQIADVITVKPSYTRFILDIYECKISRADFLSDIRSEKWKGYLQHCNRFYFALLSGIATKEDIPDEAGLIVHGDKGWTTVKAAPKREVIIPATTMMSMLFKKQSQDNFERRSYIAYYAESRYTQNKTGLKKILNPKVRKALEFYDKYQWRIEDLLKREKELL